MTTRDRLSAEAARLFAERGYHGTSIGDLAEALGIRKASIYSHIKVKEDLLDELAVTGAEAFHAALDQIPDDAEPAERLRLALQAHLGVVADQLDVATVWLREWRFLTGSARQTFLAERRRYERRVAAMFQDAMKAGALRSDLDVKRAVLVFLSIANWAYTWMTPRTKLGPEADALWSMLVEGVGPG
jgi:AcrR family transcriptional regulator